MLKALICALSLCATTVFAATPVFHSIKVDEVALKSLNDEQLRSLLLSVANIASNVEKGSNVELNKAETAIRNEMKIRSERKSSASSGDKAKGQLPMSGRYAEGLQAYRDGATKSANPYAENSPEHGEWLDGFYEGQGTTSMGK